MNEEIYMKWLVDFIIQGQSHKVCKLNWLIYGLKQSSRQWYLRFHCAISSYVFTMIDEDHCVYIKQNKDKCVIIFIMDDILIAENNLEFVQTI